MKPRILVLNSGSGSGFQKLVEYSRIGVLDADIVGLITNKDTYECINRAKDLSILFGILEKFEAEDYQQLVKDFNADFVALSGWLKTVRGLDPCTTFNIHPGPLPEFGGKGMYGHFVHEAVMKAFKEGHIKQTAVCIHFVTDAYDKGPVFFRYPIGIRSIDTAETLAARVNKVEHEWQSFVTNMVVDGRISWDGKNPESLIVPDCMKHLL